jgi:hypothetical protein
LLLLYSTANAGVFKVGYDGKIEIIKEIEQICFIDFDEVRKRQEALIGIAIPAQQEYSKYYLCIFPIPSTIQNIKFRKLDGIHVYNLQPMVYEENSNYLLNIFEIKKKFFSKIFDQTFHFTYFYLRRYYMDENQFAEKYLLKNDVNGTVIKHYNFNEHIKTIPWIIITNKQYFITLINLIFNNVKSYGLFSKNTFTCFYSMLLQLYSNLNFNYNFEIIQFSDGKELRKYFDIKNEKLPGDTYIRLNKLVSKNYSFALLRCYLAEMPSPEMSLWNYFLKNIEVEKKFVFKHNNFIISKYWHNIPPYFFNLSFPSSTIYCPLPISDSQDHDTSLKIVVNNIAYLRNFLDNDLFNIKRYYCNLSENDTQIIKSKMSFPIRFEDELNKGYTMLTTRKDIKLSGDEVIIMSGSQKLIQEIILHSGFFISLFLSTKFFLKYDYFETTIISVLVLFFTFWGSVLPIATIMLLICSMNFLKEKLSLSTLNTIHLFFFIMLICLSLYDVLMTSFHVQVFFAVAVIIYGLYMQRRGLAYIVLTALSSSCFIFLLNEFFKFLD